MAMKLPESQHTVLAQYVGQDFCLPTFTYTPSLQLAWVPCLEGQSLSRLGGCPHHGLLNLGYQIVELLVTICQMNANKPTDFTSLKRGKSLSAFSDEL